jgi:hypothetical protein
MDKKENGKRIKVLKGNGTEDKLFCEKKNVATKYAK